MIIETKELGFVKIEDQEIIHFSHAIYGFEGATRFALLYDRSKPNNPFMWLQCVDSKEPCFAVVDPHIFFSEYAPPITGEDKHAIGLSGDGYLRYLVLATVPRDVRDLTLNLKCPIIINSESNIAMQIILENSDYSMRYPLFNRMEG